MVLAPACLLVAASLVARAETSISAAPLKLPTAAGQVVADLLGEPPMELAPMMQPGPETEDTGIATAAAEISQSADERWAGASRSAWSLRGWVTEEYLLPGESNWRFDAAVVRVF